MVIWKPIPGFGDFEAGDNGEIRRVSYSRGCGKNPLPFLLKQHRNRAGYLCASLRSNDGSSAPRLVHQMVAAAFLGARPDGRMVCHKDGIKSNNRPGNLYYGTHKDNMKDCRAHGAYKGRYRDNNHPTQKLNVHEVRQIKERLGQGGKTKELADEFCVRPSTISMIASGANWGWLQ